MAALVFCSSTKSSGLFQLSRNFRAACFPQCFSRILSAASKSTTGSSDVEVSDEPVKYTTSKAAKWKASYTFDGPEAPKSTGENLVRTLILTSSLAIFLLYFGILREESDIDQELNKDPAENVPYLREAKLKGALTIARQKGQPTGSIEEELRRVQAQIDEQEARLHK